MLFVGICTFFYIQKLTSLALASVGTDLNFQVVNEFVSNGIYNYTRNPAYSSILVVTIPCIIFCFNSVWMGIGYIPLYWYINFVVVPAEEKFLGELFGGSYGAFLLSSPRFLPDWVYGVVAVIFGIHFLEFLIDFNKYKEVRKERGLIYHFIMTMVWGIVYARSFRDEKIKRR